MDNIIQLEGTEGEDFRNLAVEKIAKELAEFKGDHYGLAVKDFVASTLTHFCRQNERFAEVVYQTKRSLSDCCAAIMTGCGSHISDIDVYRAAVRYYFPNSEIDFVMQITLTGDDPSKEEMEKPAEKPAEKRPTKRAAKKERTPAKATPVKAAEPKKPQEQPKKPATPEVLQLSLF